jgi:hypothetical protein
MAMKVGVGSCRREAGEMEELRVRMYSWQFCKKYHQLNVKVVSSEKMMAWPFRLIRRGEGRGMNGTYSAEEMPYEYYQYPPRDIGSCV